MYSDFIGDLIWNRIAYSLDDIYKYIDATAQRNERADRKSFEGLCDFLGLDSVEKVRNVPVDSLVIVPVQGNIDSREVIIRLTFEQPIACSLIKERLLIHLGRVFEKFEAFNGTVDATFHPLDDFLIVEFRWNGIIKRCNDVRPEIHL